MQRDDALHLLRERREQLHALGVGRLFLYGSVARNEAREDSDVDLLVEPSNQRFSIFDLVRLRDLCRTILGTTADIHDSNGAGSGQESPRALSRNDGMLERAA